MRLSIQERNIVITSLPSQPRQAGRQAQAPKYMYEDPLNVIIFWVKNKEGRPYSAMISHPDPDLPLALSFLILSNFPFEPFWEQINK